MRVCLFGGKILPHRGSHHLSFSLSKAKYLKRVLESFFFLRHFFTAAIVFFFFFCFIYFIFFDHPEEPRKPAEHLSVVAANCQKISIVLCVFYSERSCFSIIPLKELLMGIQGFCRAN